MDWFFIVLASLLIVASITVVPLVIPEKRGLWTLASFTGLLVLLLLVTCMFVRGSWFFLVALPILGFCLILPWAMFLCIRYTKWNPFTKAGAVALLIGGFVAIANDIITWIVYGKLTFQMLRVNLFNWNHLNFDANSNFIISVGCIIAGILLLVVGAKLKKKGDIEAK